MTRRFSAKNRNSIPSIVVRIRCSRFFTSLVSRIALKPLNRCERITGKEKEKVEFAERGAPLAAISRNGARLLLQPPEEAGGCKRKSEKGKRLRNADGVPNAVCTIRNTIGKNDKRLLLYRWRSAIRWIISAYAFSAAVRTFCASREHLDFHPAEKIEWHIRRRRCAMFCK